ncbi:PREDICTED: uncharacterized protein LOC108356060, partial [Rhagoletis zephyria]|uniref:uncharacterized protein LOC108356060 n=1 Tax=Rhagoletis zephyria TaxID=28612 RepID=UPI0008116D6B
MQNIRKLVSQLVVLLSVGYWQRYAHYISHSLVTANVFTAKSLEMKPNTNQLTCNSFRCASCSKATHEHTLISSGILNNLFEGLTDKDETVRTAIKSSLIKILETHPARATDILVDYRGRNPKLPEQTVITLL